LKKEPANPSLQLSKSKSWPNTSEIRSQTKNPRMRQERVRVSGTKSGRISRIRTVKARLRVMRKRMKMG